MPNPIPTIQEPIRSAWYSAAMARLVGVVQELSLARNVDAVAAIVREAARSLTGADGATFVLRDKDQCYYADESAIAPLWKGCRFPMSACISGWVMLNGTSAVIEDIYADPRIPADAYRPTFVKSLAMVPIRRSDPIGAIGNYWASRRDPTEEEVAILQALADTTSVAMENAEFFTQLQEQVCQLREQQSCIQAQRDTLDVFTRALAHDLKEPVRTMKSFSRLVLNENHAREPQEHYLQFIQSAADRMSILVDSVMHYMQLEDPEGMSLESCSMPDVLNAVQENLAQLVQERGAVIMSGELPVVAAYRINITQVLQNMIENAIRHNDRPVLIEVGATRRADDWLFFVRDNGRGVPIEYVQRIFQPFKRLDSLPECAGLGLAICEKVITRHGGTIWCEASPGEGATFFFTLPHNAGVQDGAAMVHAARATLSQAADQPLANVLLVDDRPDDLMLSQMMLSQEASLRSRVLTAQGGEEALAVLRREPIDLMLLDINMPGVDGFDVLESMKRDEVLRHVAVIMCTGSDYQKDKDRAMSLGAVGYLVKPARFHELKPMLERIPTLRLSHESGNHSLRRVGAAA